MSKRDQALRSLVKELGADYCIRTIDGEPCPYRDFGNGFNVEVSGMHTSSMRKTANIYLWFGDEGIYSLMVKTVRGVPRDEIAAKVDELYEYSEKLLADGYDTRDKLFDMKFPETRRAWNVAEGGKSMLHKIFYGTKPKLTQRDAKIFSRGKFECKLLLQKTNGMPVAVSQSNDPEYPFWREDYGFSSLFFKTYGEAMAYCKDRFVDLDGKGV